MEELREIQQLLLHQIEVVQGRDDAKEYSRELRTSKAALKGINELLAATRQQQAA